MNRVILVSLFSAGLMGLAIPTQADHRFSYPRVRTFSGGYYGPTQAHYQYQRRYGRPWHGQGGFYGGAGVGAVNGFSGGYGAVVGGWAFPGFGYSGYGYSSPFGYGASYNGFGTYGYGAFAPVWGGGFGAPSPFGGYGDPYASGFGLTTSPTAPGWLDPPPPLNPVLNDAWEENAQQWGQPLEQLPVIASGKPSLPASTPAARIRSIQFQQHGDRRLRDVDYLQASSRYKDAISAAPDRADPHLHLALAFAGMKQFEKAVQELKVGLALDPAWPSSGVSLDGIFGPDNILNKMHLKQWIAEWALQDVRDPDRLFLLGATMYLDNDIERARYILETAARLGGLQEHLAVFLRPGDTAVAGGNPELTDNDAAAVLPPLPVPALPNVRPPTSGGQPVESSVPVPSLTGPTFPN